MTPALRIEHDGTVLKHSSANRSVADWWNGDMYMLEIGLSS